MKFFIPNFSLLLLQEETTHQYRSFNPFSRSVFDMQDTRGLRVKKELSR